MSGIYIAAFLTSLLAIVGFGTLIRKLDKPATGWLLLAAVLVCLPLQPLAFYFVRLPLDHWLAGHLTRTSSVYQWLVTLYAPLTEEPAKLLVLLIPAILRDTRPDNFPRYALAIGLGFALGEMWFIAERVSHQPALAKLPFYQFGGYLNERLMTCVFHSAFVAITLSRLRRGWLLGLGGAMVAHWAANFPLTLMAWNVGGLGRTNWEVIVGLWLVALLVGAVAWFAYLIFGQVLPLRLMYGIRHCPECATDFEPFMLAINFGSERYERCPHCRKWLWTKRSAAKQVEGHKPQGVRWRTCFFFTPTVRRFPWGGFGSSGALRFGVRRSSGAFECPMACAKLQRTGALQDAGAIFTILRPDTLLRF